MIQVRNIDGGVAVAFPLDDDRNQRFKATFPRARWSIERREWIVPGVRAPQRVERWVAEELEVERQKQLEEERARDALAFDPLPESPWLSVGLDGIYVRTPYHPEIVRMLKMMGGVWRLDEGAWRMPFISRGRLTTALPEIDRLALNAAAEAERQRAEDAARKAKEDEKRERERAQQRAERREKVLDRARTQPPRPLRREYLVPRENAPKHHLELQSLGDNEYQELRRSGQAVSPPCWVAQIWGSCPKFGFARSFLDGARDYAKANSRGSRGVRVSYILEEGPIYEVKERVSWGRSERYFLRIWDGERIQMTEEEVRACLER